MIRPGLDLYAFFKIAGRTADFVVQMGKKVYLQCWRLSFARNKPVPAR